MADRQVNGGGPHGPSPRLLTALVTLSASLLAVALALGGYLLFNWSRIERTRTELLSRRELQAELLRSQPSDMAVIPHQDRRIGFVLNPGMKEATWFGLPDAPYAINGLGLRGEEIHAKTAGRARVLVVGDSVVFGWKLAEADRLSSVISRRLAEAGLGDEVEVYTVALPGWNVLSQFAFLDSYHEILRPDVVIWTVIPNDVHDVFGVAPPGLLQMNVSSQRQEPTPFEASTKDQRMSPLPSVLDRWDRNLSLVEAYRERFGVPVLLLNFLQKALPLFQDRLERLGVDLPVVSVPASIFEDPRWRLSESDGHPTPWANAQLAVGLLSSLARDGRISPLAFTAADEAVAETFRAASQPVSAREIRRFYDEKIRAVPRVAEDWQESYADNVVFGVRSRRMDQNGLLFIRASAPARSIGLRLRVPGTARLGSRSVDVVVRELGGQTSEGSFVLDTGRVEIVAPAPGTASEIPVFEVAWRFDHLVCRSALECDSGVLLEAVAVRTGR